jgi:protein TonB
MEMNYIIPPDFLDILFEGRNKEYGAYDLRKMYNHRLLMSLSATGLACLILTAIYFLGSKNNRAFRIVNPEDTGIKLSEMNLKEKNESPLHIPIQKPIQVQTVKFVSFRIIKDKLVNAKDQIPDLPEIEQARIGNFNQKGVIDASIPNPPAGDGTGVMPAPMKSEFEGEAFRKVEIESTYPGGEEAWKRYLLKNFHAPDEAINNGVQGTVLVEFIVDVTGNVSNVRAISGPEELRDEAVRVIRKSGNWTPAIQNGKEVKSYKCQPITVILQHE